MLTCAALVAAAGAQAQVSLSGSVALVSDYRHRGVSLSDRQPAAQANLTVDDASGAYAGLFASSVRIAPNGRSGTQMLVHAGYSARVHDTSFAWDVGVAYTHFTRPPEYAYAEYYAGVAGAGFSAQLSYAPRYFGQPIGATYAQINLAPFSERDLAPIIHIGFLRTDAARGYSAQERWDTRIGLVYGRDLLSAQLAWDAVSERDSDRRSKPGWVLRLTRWL